MALVEDDAEDPTARIRELLETAYAAHAEDGILVEAEDLDATARELGTIRARNVFPAMKLTWGTYPTFTGHQDDGGCFRCHDGLHMSASGRTISDDCETCHVILAEEEEEPAILTELYDGTW